MSFVKKCLIRQSISIGPQMYQLVQRVLQGDAKAQLDTQTAAAGNQMVTNLRDVLATIIARIFPQDALCNQKRNLSRHLKKPLNIHMENMSCTSRYYIGGISTYDKILNIPNTMEIRSCERGITWFYSSL